MVRSLSTWLAAIIILSVGACADPKGRFDDFGNRVIDAGGGGTIDARPVDEVPDISGQFLLTIVPVPIEPDANIHYIADVTMTQDSGDIRVDLEMRALDFETLELLDPDSPDTWEGIPVNGGTGELDIELAATLIPGRANAAIPGLPVAVTGNIHAVIQSADTWCGDVTGTTQFGSSLDGSTMGAIRIEPGTLGMDLPAPVRACPGSGGDVDAGVPDAGPIDAAPADAAPADAAPDAAPVDAAPAAPDAAPDAAPGA